MKKVSSGLAAVVALATLSALFACSEDVKDKAASTGDGGADGGDAFASGVELRVNVPASGRVYVKLGGSPAVVTPAADPKTDLGWDIAFEGFEVYTNSGPSGGGAAAGFGPLDSLVFIEDVAPAVPFLSEDRTGGAFVRWWFYDGANHALDSRFHVFGVKDADKEYKVQILGYYGDRDGAPVSGLYRVRFAEVTAGGVGPVSDIAGLDGTAGGPQGGPDSPSECIDLGTKTRTMLTQAQARTSTAWHLCFRRQDISVNGDIGGPRNVGAVDLEADKIATETIEQVAALTPESEQARFDTVNAQSLAGKSFRGDGIVSAFTTLWTEPGSNPPTPRNSAWLVQGADGKSKFLIGFSKFENMTPTSPGTVVMRVKAVSGS